MLAAITDRRIQAAIMQRSAQLAEEPEKQGKALSGDLLGYRSIRAVGQRFRIIYRIEEDAVIVVIVALGLRKTGSRKDIYSIAHKLLQQGLLSPPRDETG